MRDLYVDFCRDWRRWSKAEQLSAGLLLVMSLVGSAALLFG